MYLIKAENVVIDYGSDKIKVDSFYLKEGEAVGLIGPNGGGKSSFIKSILGLVPFNGKIDLNVKREEIGYLPQRVGDSLVPFTVRDVISFVETTGDYWEVSHLMDRLFFSLSGGERQRVLLARAFHNKAKLVILDEPEANLDVYWRSKLFSFIKKAKERGISVLFATHEISLTFSFVDRLACISKSFFVHDKPKYVLPKLENVYGCELVGFFHGDREHMGRKHWIGKKHK